MTDRVLIGDAMTKSAESVASLVANINALLDQLASQRRLAAIPAQFCCQECGASKAIEDAVLCRKCCDYLLSVPAAERPALTCATCKWFNGLMCLDARFDQRTCASRNPMHAKRVYHPGEFGCIFHEPVPPGQAAQEAENSSAENDDRCSAMFRRGRCGLRKDHDGDHTLLVPSDVPWAKPVTRENR